LWRYGQRRDPWEGGLVLRSSLWPVYHWRADGVYIRVWLFGTTPNRDANPDQHQDWDSDTNHYAYSNSDGDSNRYVYSHHNWHPDPRPDANLYSNGDLYPNDNRNPDYYVYPDHYVYAYDNVYADAWTDLYADADANSKSL
jgi:hypothetical protein